MPTICVFTGTRAEFGLLDPIARGLQAAGANLQLLVTGSHLGGSRGSSLREIEQSEFPVVERVEVNMASDGNDAICTAMGLGLIRYSDVLRRLNPDCVVLLGDRFEALAMATVAAVWQIPIVHLHGGELTFGAIDDEFRHAITKMSSLHFTSTEVYRRRAIQLGEDPQRVFNVGALGVENALSLPLLGRAEITAKLGLMQDQQYFIATFHPETRGSVCNESQLRELFAALATFPNFVTVFTAANADAGGGSINRMIEAYAGQNPDRVRYFGTLGHLGYLSAAKYATAVIGNSSSGIIEIPSLGVPSIDIGSRQFGRVRGDSVLSCEGYTSAISSAIEVALSKSFRDLAKNAKNPYQGQNTTEVILHHLMQTDFRNLPKKTFYDLPHHQAS